MEIGTVISGLQSASLADLLLLLRQVANGIMGLAIIVVLALVARTLARRFITGLIERSVERAKARGESNADELTKRYTTIGGVAVKGSIVVIWIIAGITALSQVGIDIAPVLAGAGVVGIALGLGAQSLVKDVISGVFVLVENQYRKGDVVKVAGIGGLVEDVNLRTTILRDLDGTVHYIPNGEIRTASNLTREWSRVNLNVSVAYGEDLDRVTAVINRVGRELAEDPAFAPIIVEAPQVLRVDELGDSGVGLKVLGVTKPIRQWEVTGELRRRLKRAFDEEGIEIPFPQRVLWVRDDAKKKSQEVLGSTSSDPGNSV